MKKGCQKQPRSLKNLTAVSIRSEKSVLYPVHITDFSGRIPANDNQLTQWRIRAY